MAITSMPTQPQSPSDVTLTSVSGSQAGVTLFNELMVGTKQTDIAVQFQYNLSTEDVKSTIVDTGTTTQATNMGVVSSGTGTSASAIMESKHSIRYRPADEAYGYFTAQWDDGGLANTVQAIGTFSADNGFFVGYNGTTFGCGYRKNTVDTHITQANFNKDTLDGNGPSGFNLNTSYLNIFLIQYGWLGTAPVVFSVYGGINNGWIPFHIIDFPNTQAGTSIGNPVLPICCDVTKTSAAATSVTMKTGSWTGGAYNGSKEDNASHRRFTVDSSKTLSSGTLTNILTLQSPTTFQGETNRVRSALNYLSVDSDGTKPVTIRLLEGATLGGVPSYSAVDATNSVLEIDTAGTTVTGGTLKGEFHLSKAADLNESLIELDIDIHTGERVTLAAESAAASDIEGSITYKDYF